MSFVYIWISHSSPPWHLLNCCGISLSNLPFIQALSWTSKVFRCFLHARQWEAVLRVSETVTSSTSEKVWRSCFSFLCIMNPLINHITADRNWWNKSQFADNKSSRRFSHSWIFHAQINNSSPNVRKSFSKQKIVWLTIHFRRRIPKLPSKLMTLFRHWVTRWINSGRETLRAESWRLLEIYRANGILHDNELHGFMLINNLLNFFIRSLEDFYKFEAVYMTVLTYFRLSRASSNKLAVCYF